MNTLNYDDLRADFKLTSSGDAWGDVMSWLFTIADHLHFTTGETPDHWQFKPSPLGPANDPDDYVTQVCIDADINDLTRFGNTLCRYADLLKAAGKDY